MSHTCFQSEAWAVTEPVAQTHMSIHSRCVSQEVRANGLVIEHSAVFAVFPVVVIARGNEDPF